MRKNGLKTLSLSRESLRNLSDSGFLAVNGAGTDTCGAGPHGCAITNAYGYTCQPSDFGWTCAGC